MWLVPAGSIAPRTKTTLTSVTFGRATSSSLRELMQNFPYALTLTVSSFFSAYLCRSMKIIATLPQAYKPTQDPLLKANVIDIKWDYTCC